MSVTTTLAACSTIVANNGPDGTIDPPSTLDDAIRYSLSFVATLRDTKAPLASPALTGVPTAPTPVTTDNSTTLATTAYVKAAVVAGQSGVATFNSRAGAVTLAGSDVSGAGGALSATLAASAGASLIGFTRAETGAVARTEQDKLRETISVTDFGADPTGVADSTAAVQAAVNALSSGILFFPKGTYKVSGTITLPNAIVCRGDGKYASIVRTTSATLAVFICTASSAYEFSDLTIGTSVVRTGAEYIKMAPTTGYNNDSTFKRINFSQPYIGLSFISGAGWAVEDCYFSSYVSVGITVANAATPDAGDCYIGDCTFDGTGASGIAVSQTSAGGLKIIGNKFLAGAYHYLGQFNTGATGTTILVIDGNSSENASTTNFAFSSAANTSFGRIVIAGNQVSIAANATGISVSDPGYVWLDGISIDANQFAFGTGATGLNIARASRVSLGKNTYLGNGTSTGIVFGVNNGVAVIGFQDFLNITTEYSGTFTSTTFNPPRIEGGTASGTTSTAYGTLFSSTAATITFSKPFAKAPLVSANAFATAGGTSVLIGTPTTTGFAYQMIGVTSGGVTSMQWLAQG